MNNTPPIINFDLLNMCKCDDPQCAKCLGINCMDKNCPTHTKEAKANWRKQWEFAHKEPFPHTENY